MPTSKEPTTTAPPIVVTTTAAYELPTTTEEPPTTSGMHEHHEHLLILFAISRKTYTARANLNDEDNAMTYRFHGGFAEYTFRDVKWHR